jgi:hypothetical protein
LTCALTTAIAVPNVTRWKIIDCAFHDSISTAYVTLQVLSSPASGRTKFFTLIVANTVSNTLVKKATPTNFDDDVDLGPSASTPGAYDRLEAAYSGGATKAARFRAAESQLLTDAIVASTLAGVVS